jgi:hypothetical protein
METNGNKTAILFPLCSNCFHFSSLLPLKFLLLSQLGFSADRKVVVVPFVVFTSFAKPF